MHKYLLIVNPLSGGKDKTELVKMLDKQLQFEHEIVYTRYPGHASELARDTDADVVVAVGGDGTANEVARGLIGTEKALAIAPCGSGNGLAYHLGLSLKPSRIIRTLNRGVITHMDCAFVNGEPFLCTAGVGLDADVAWQFASSPERGLKTYVRLAWKLWKQYKPLSYTLRVDEKEFTLPAVMVTVGNANQWGNHARIADQASLQDGLLNLVVVKPFKTIEIPILVAKLMDGRAHTSFRVQHFTAKKIVIERPREGYFHRDGDSSLAGRRLEFSVQPNALRVITPPQQDI